MNDTVVKKREDHPHLRKRRSVLVSDGELLLVLVKASDAVPRPQVCVYDVLQVRLQLQVILVLCARLFDQTRDVHVSDLLVQEQLHRLLVRGTEDACHGSPRPPCCVGQVQGRVLLSIRFAECQVSHLDEVQSRPGLLGGEDPPRPGQGVQNGQPHVRPSKLGNDGGIGRFHHGVDDALGMDHYVDVVVVRPEEVVRFDDFQTLVHQRRRIDRDLASHAPVGMLQGVCHLGVPQPLDGPVAKRPARGGQDDSPHSSLGQTCHITLARSTDGPLARDRTLDALEDGRVFRIGRQDLDAVLFGQRQDVRTTGDQGLFVGQTDVLSRLDGRHRRSESSTSNDARHHGLNVWMPCSFDRALCSSQNLRLRIHVPNELLQLGDSTSILQSHELRFELSNLLGKQLDVRTSTERDDGEFLGMLGADVERLRADRTRRPEQRNRLRHIATP